MNLSQLSPAPGSRPKATRVGRGIGSGQGKTSARGHKGQMARSGAKRRVGFEGGQMPLQRRIPKRGFTNIFRKEIVEVNVDRLNVFEDGAVINCVSLVEAGIVKNVKDGVKILGNGELTKKLTVALPTSASAAEKIVAAGGKVEVI